MSETYANFWCDSHDPVYDTRQSRNEFVAKLIAADFPDAAEIINVGGGGKRHLQAALSEAGVAGSRSVREIDMVGDCDLIINLDEVDALPLEDGAADLCVATDILEHLENFHLVSRELVRVARNAVIISLPVPTNSFLHIAADNRQREPAQRGVFDKFYGLPLEKPEDRHRWWYAVEDVERYFAHLAQELNLELRFFTTRRAYRVQGLKGKLLRLVLGRRLYRNIRYPYVWIVLKKPAVQPKKKAKVKKAGRSS